jgi:hypothetical protein
LSCKEEKSLSFLLIILPVCNIVKQMDNALSLYWQHSNFDQIQFVICIIWLHCAAQKTYPSHALGHVNQSWLGCKGLVYERKEPDAILQQQPYSDCFCLGVVYLLLFFGWECLLNQLFLLNVFNEYILYELPFTYHLLPYSLIQALCSLVVMWLVLFYII